MGHRPPPRQGGVARGQVLCSMCVCDCVPNRVAACDIEYGEWRYTRTIVRRGVHAMPDTRLLVLARRSTRLDRAPPWGIATADAAAAAELWEVHDSVFRSVVVLAFCSCLARCRWTKFTCVEEDLRHVARWWRYVMRNAED